MHIYTESCSPLNAVDFGSATPYLTCLCGLVSQGFISFVIPLLLSSVSFCIWKKSPSFLGFVLSGSSSKNTSSAVLWEILLGGLPVPHWIWPCSQSPFITNSDGTCSCICLNRQKGFPSIRYAPLLLDWGGRRGELQGWCGLLVRSQLKTKL